MEPKIIIRWRYNTLSGSVTLSGAGAHVIESNNALINPLALSGSINSVVLGVGDLVLQG